MVVQRAEGVRHIQPVMYRVEVFVQELVYVHPAVQEVLPSVDNEPGTNINIGDKKCAAADLHSEKQLSNGGCPPIDIINHLIRPLFP